MCPSTPFSCSGRALRGGANSKKGRDSMGLILAFIAAWWLRGVLAIIALILAWNFLVPPGSFGKPPSVAEVSAQPRVVVQQPPAAPAAPAATAVPAVVPPPASAPAAASVACQAVPSDGYGLDLKPEVATSGTYIRVQYWWEGQPERETYIPASAAGGGRFILTRALRGHVWEFHGNCTDADMTADVKGSIARRLAGGANNAGYVEWQATGLFRPAVPPS